jgi:hypothetical protein
MPTGTVAKPPRDLSDLITLFGSVDDIATVDNFGFAKRAGEIIARSGGNIQRQYRARRERVSKRREIDRTMLI